MKDNLVSKNNVVIYHNDLNTVSLKNFTTVETRIFMAIIMRARNKGLSKITFTFDELRAITSFKHTAIKSFVAALERVYDKVMGTSIKIGTETEFRKFSVFTEYEVSSSKKILHLCINPQFEYLINNLGQAFTLFEWKQFSKLEYQYSQRLYFELKQYRKTGYRIFTIEDFKKMLGVPENYLMHHIDKKILKPCLSELQFIFENLKVVKIKDGRRISHLEFYFKNEDDIMSDGLKIFRDQNGNFYTKNLYDFNDEEVKKTYPDNPEILPNNIRKNVNKQFSKKNTRKKKVPEEKLCQLVFKS